MAKMEREVIENLIQDSLEARKNSYCPYSGYAVGAALLAFDNDNNRIVYKGCNIENASYGATNCAERTAVFKAVSEGVTRFKAIAITGGPKGEEPRDYAFPCGVCRQVMAEFCGKDFTVIVALSKDVYKVYKFSELLPEAFGAANME